MTRTASGIVQQVGGQRADAAFRWLATAAGGLVLLILGLMITTTALEAWPILREEGLGFVTGTDWRPGASRTDVTGTYGALGFLFGTIVTSLLALGAAVPMAVGVALYLTHVAPARLRLVLIYAVDVLAMIPSVVIGLWGVVFFVPFVVYPVMSWLTEVAGGFPPFAPPATVRSVFAAGVVLTLMILPIVTAITREVFATTPREEREAAYGIGATDWEVMRHVVLPRARAGVVGAAMLGLGRALGETIAVLLVIGGSARIGIELFQPGQTIAGQIASGFAEASPEGIRGLIALGVALFAMTIAINMAARIVIERLGHRGAETAW